MTPPNASTHPNPATGTTGTDDETLESVRRWISERLAWERFLARAAARAAGEGVTQPAADQPVPDEAEAA